MDDVGLQVQSCERRATGSGLGQSGLGLQDSGCQDLGKWCLKLCRLPHSFFCIGIMKVRHKIAGMKSSGHGKGIRLGPGWFQRMANGPTVLCDLGTNPVCRIHSLGGSIQVGRSLLRVLWG